MALSLTGRDDADDIAIRSAAVADHEQSQATAQPEQDKSVFLFGVVRVIDELGILVCEDSLSVLEAHPVLAQVRNCLLGISLEFEHSRSVRSLYIHFKQAAEPRERLGARALPDEAMAMGYGYPR